MPRRPPPRRSRRRVPARRRRAKSRIGRPGRPLAAPRPYLFKRHISETLSLSNSSPPAGWTSTAHNLGKAFGWTLTSVNDHDDFKNLFKYYRLKGARVRMYFSNTGSMFDDAGGVSNNGQILMTVDRNVNGATGLVATESHYLDSQTSKRRLCLRSDGKPVDIYMPLKHAAA